MTGTQLAAFKAAGLPAIDMSKFKSAVKGAAQAAKQAASGALLLRLLRDGIWVYGPDDVEVQESSQWVINPYSLAMGYAAWGQEKTPLEGTLAGERMAIITDPQVDPEGLPDIQYAPWNVQVQFDLLCLTGEDVGTLVRYKTTSVGGRRAFAGLVQEVSNQADDAGMIVPVVTLESDSYQHKKYGRTYVPVFELVEWKSPDDTELGTADADTAGDAAKPDAPTTAASQAPQEPEPKAQTTRTRRQPAAQRPVAPAAAPQAEATKPRATRRPAATSPTEAPKEPPKGAAVDRGAVVRRRRR